MCIRGVACVYWMCVKCVLHACVSDMYQICGICWNVGEMGVKCQLFARYVLGVCVCVCARTLAHLYTIMQSTAIKLQIRIV